MRLRALFIVFTLVLTAALRAEDGERYALLIGVNEYNANSNLTALKYAETDMGQLAKALVEAGFKPENIRLMIQGEIKDARFKPQRGSSDQFKPRKANIETELDLLLRNKRDEDTVVIAFAGHGLQYRDKQEVYFCPADAKVTDAGTLVELTGIIKLLNDSAAGAKLMIADCCRNNPLEEGLRADLGTKVESATRLFSIEKPKSLATLLSCGKGEFAREEKDLNGGVFTHFLVEGLRGKASRDGVVEMAGLASYVQYNVYEYVRKKYGVTQTPEYKMSLGRPMILARGLKQKQDAAGETRVARPYKLTASMRLTESYTNGQTQTTNTESEYDYTWQVNGSQRTFSVGSARVRREINGVHALNYYVDKTSAWDVNAYGVKTEYTEQTLQQNIALARNFLNLPLYNVKLDDDGKAIERTPLVTQQALTGLEQLQWDISEVATIRLLPYKADEDEWTTEAEVSITSGISAKGTMKIKKIPGGIGGQAVKVSAVFTNPSFINPLANIRVENYQVKAEGTQVYDTQTGEWILAQYNSETTFTTPVGSLRNVNISKVEKR